MLSVFILVSAFILEVASDRFTALAMSSGPLSERMKVGSPPASSTRRDLRIRESGSKGNRR
jgi:hypothetical protein